MSKRLIYVEDAIEALDIGCELLRRALDDTDVVSVERAKYEWGLGLIESYIADIKDLPSAQPEIIRCNVCRHWHQTTGEMKGFGLGDCDYLEKKLVTCNGYCYWAERKEDE